MGDLQAPLDAILAGLSGTTTAALRIGAIVILAWVASSMLQRAIRAFRMRLSSRFSDPEMVKRAETLGRVFRYLVAVVVWAMAVMLVLGEIGISVAPILGAAGVVGLAVGFGAQSLVKDYVNGLFILLENQIRVGDVVRLGSHAGTVEVVTLRHVALRDYNGHVHYVPNGQIDSVVNLSRDHAYAVIDIGVAYREDVDAVMQVMKETGTAMYEDPVFRGVILEDLEMAGVDALADSAVMIRCRFKCAPLLQWRVRREYLRRVKQGFDARGIEIPFPHVTVYAGQDKSGLAPAMPLSLQRLAGSAQVSGR